MAVWGWRGGGVRGGTENSGSQTILIEITTKQTEWVRVWRRKMGGGLSERRQQGIAWVGGWGTGVVGGAGRGKRGIGGQENGGGLGKETVEVRVGWKWQPALNAAHVATRYSSLHRSDSLNGPILMFFCIVPISKRIVSPKPSDLS